MGVLKNDVGRPSNKTIRTRFILKLIGLILVVGLAFLGGYKLSDNKEQTKTDKKTNKVDVVKKEDVSIPDAKKIMEEFFTPNYSIAGQEYDKTEKYEYRINYENDVLKTLASISKVKGEKQISKEELCENFKCEYKGNELFYVVEDISFNDFSASYNLEDVEKVFNKNYKNGEVYKFPIKEDCGWIITLKQGKYYKFICNNCGCGNGETYPVNDVYEAYKQGNKLYIIMSTAPVDYADDWYVILKDGTKIKYDLEQDRIIEKYGHNMKQYELEFELIDSGYMFLGQKELN